ncbi:MAG: triose-phosphate isomerase [bacterium]|nr:triose-phosphate isomerase [bacterium]
MSAKKLLIFNWKMAPDSLKEAISLFERTRTCADKTRNHAETIIAPPFVYLSNLSKVKSSLFGRSPVGRQKSKVALAAQNVFWEDSVAYTGEISASMLKDLGVEYAIIGHSERRKYLSAEGGFASGGNETDKMINKKILASLKAGLKVILCVGEPTQRGQTRTERGLTRNIKWAKNYVKNQLEKDLKNLIQNLKPKTQNLIIAYEPLWSIGTGHSDAPQDAAEMINFIKNILKAKTYNLKPKVLYGGSVNSKNIAKFLKHPEIDGALVGHASLKPKEVKAIIEIASKMC